jgi:hypothetical protein
VISRGGIQPLAPEELDGLCELVGIGTTYAMVFAEDLTDASLWRGDPGSGWEVVENGLWTLDPDGRTRRARRRPGGVPYITFGNSSSRK